MSKPEAVQPPWIEYSGSDPTWSGWRQGKSESWLDSIWMPFWQQLSPQEREEYLQRWPPPDEDWRTYLLEYWV